MRGQGHFSSGRARAGATYGALRQLSYLRAAAFLSSVSAIAGRRCGSAEPPRRAHGTRRPRGLRALAGTRRTASRTSTSPSRDAQVAMVCAHDGTLPCAGQVDGAQFVGMITQLQLSSRHPGYPHPRRPPDVGEPPPPSCPALGGPRSPVAATGAHRSAVAAELARCADNFGMLSKPFQDSDQVSEGEAVAMLQACGFSAEACTEILHEALMVAASPDQCTPSTMPAPISLFAESDECGASGAHCAPPNDTALMGISSPLLPCSANTPANALTPRRQLAFT